MSNNTYQMAINYNAGGQFATNILHFLFDDASYTTSAAAAKGLCAGWDAAKRTALRNILSSHVTILGYKARKISGPGGFEGSLLLTTANTGNRTGMLMVAGTGPVTIWIPSGNAPQRGRTFWPGITDLDCFDGILTDAFKTVMQTSENTILATFPATGGATPTVQPVIWSKNLLAVNNIQYGQASMMVGQTRRRQLPS